MHPYSWYLFFPRHGILGGEVLKMPKSSFEEGFCELLMTPEWHDLEKHLFAAVEMAYAFGWASAGGPRPT